MKEMLRRLARLETERERDATGQAADPATAARAWAELDRVGAQIG